MKVSIVTISYNQAAFLEKAICSVIDQDYPHIEYIVVDPGSSDGSRDIINRYRGKIDRVIFEPDRGPADGLNKGFQYATGEIFGYLNSDDILLPGAVSRYASAFQKKDADVISGHAYSIDSSGNVLKRLFSHRFDPAGYVYGACILIQQSTFFRASAFRATSGFNVANRVSWDGELWFDMAMAGARFSRIGGYWSCFRMHPESITVSGRLRHDEADVKERLAKRLNISKKSINNKRYQKLYWLKNRLFDPMTSSLRLLDMFR